MRWALRYYRSTTRLARVDAVDDRATLIRRIGQVALIGVGGVVAAALLMVYADNRNNPLIPSGRWLGWAVQTVLIFVVLVRDYRPSWSKASFWITVLGLIGAHALAYAAAFSRVEQWRGLWFLPITLIEYPVLLTILDWLRHRPGPTTRSMKPR